MMMGIYDQRYEMVSEAHRDIHTSLRLYSVGM